MLASIQRGQNRYRAACCSERMPGSTSAEVLMVEVHLDLEYGSRRVVEWILNHAS